MKNLPTAPNRGDIEWSQRTDSNRRPTDYKSVALPTETRWLTLRQDLYYLLGTAMSIQKPDLRVIMGIGAYCCLKDAYSLSFSASLESR